MSERIRELAEQVKVYMDGSDDLEVFTEKFAELILRDAAQYIENPIAVSKLMSKYGVRN